MAHCLCLFLRLSRAAHSIASDSRPVSTYSGDTTEPADELRVEDMTPWQRRFSSAWQAADTRSSQVRRQEEEKGGESGRGSLSLGEMGKRRREGEKGVS